MQLRGFKMVGLVLLLQAGTAQAAGSESIKQSLGEGAENTQLKWSKKVLKLADGIDSFFGNERIEEDAQQTRIKLRLDLEEDENEGLDSKLRLSARVSLPRAENKLAIIINADDDDDDDALDEDQPRGLALRFDAKSSLTRNLAFDIGLRRPDDSYEVYARARHRKTQPHGKWISRFDNKLYAYADYGLEYDGKLDFDLALPPTWLFRSRTRLRWWDNDDDCNGGFCPEQHFMFYQRMNSPKHALAYEASSFFQTEPEIGSSDYLDEARLRVRYRHRMPWDWAFFELRPTVSFPRDYDYEPTWSIVLRLEAIFGYKPRYDTLDFGPMYGESGQYGPGW